MYRTFICYLLPKQYSMVNFKIVLDFIVPRDRIMEFWSLFLFQILQNYLLDFFGLF